MTVFSDWPVNVDVKPKTMCGRLVSRWQLTRRTKDPFAVSCCSQDNLIGEYPGSKNVSHSGQPARLNKQRENLWLDLKGIHVKFFTLDQNVGIKLKCILTIFGLFTSCRFQDIAVQS